MTATVAIIGYGRLGRALAGLVRDAGHDVRAHDPLVTVPDAIAAPTLTAAVDGADWVILAVPVPVMRDVLQTLRPCMKATQIVVDVGSVKQEPCQWLDETLGDGIPHIGSHPLFGPLSLARGERPLRVVLCASDRHPDVLPRARDFYASLGCEIIERQPAEHDQAMARTHAMAFYIAKALVEMGVGEDLSLAPPSFLGLRHMLDAVREDAGHLFAAIQGENPYAPAAREDLLEHLHRIDDRLKAGDAASLSIPGNDTVD